MNRSQLKPLVILLAISFVACIHPNEETQQSASGFNDSHLATSTLPNSTSEAIQKKPIKYLPIPDYENNMIMALLPVPTDWDFYKGDDKDIFLEGPNGIKGFYIQGNSFMFSQNAYMNQAFQQMGATVKPFEPLSNSIQFLNQALGADGFSLEKQYDLPQFEQMAYYFDQQIFKGEPEQKSFKVVGTEWKKGDSHTLIVIQHYYAETQHGYHWGYHVESMEASSKIFNQAKQDYLNAKLNVRMNPQWITKVNNKNRIASQNSRNAHEGRMNALRAQGRQIIANGKKHDAMTTRTHQKFMDGLNDRIAVTNPSNGQNYKVELGSNHYWINENNQLITSDNANYNPNGDLNVNGSWTEAQINY